ncbi:MAG: LPS export ABC transporter periplasmic protein LptC [Bryobacteraceae bacterium]
MRRTRWILLVGIVILLGALGLTFYFQREFLRGRAPQRPSPLPDNLNATAEYWSWSNTTNGVTNAEIRARSFREIKDPPSFELEEVELRLYRNDGASFDLVKSASALFDPSAGTMYSEGEVEITMGVPEEGPRTGRLVLIRSSGVTFDIQTGKAETERPANFTFDGGEGKSTGAYYDPTTKELHLRRDVEVTWRGDSPNAQPMLVQAGEMIYKEGNSYILLFPWSRLIRGGMTLNAADSAVYLKDGAIDIVEARKATGIDLLPQRRVEYAAALLRMKFTPKGQIEKIDGEEDARLISVTESARTEVTSRRMDLEFEANATDSVLRKALAIGGAAVQSKPIVKQGAVVPETRVLRSETIFLAMRPGGREIDQVETHAPGTVEFLPNSPGQRRRELDGERIWITYGAENHIESFRSVNVSTRTFPAPRKDRKPQPPTRTWSVDLVAQFDPKTGQMTRMEQWNDFRYEEGDLRAKADSAVLDSPADQITLSGGARVWDPAGSTAADRILLARSNGDFTAEGNVTSTRLPDGQSASGGAMLSRDEPVQARAQRMHSTEDNARIRYEGSAVLWQGANRIQADRIDIDRKRDQLAADGSVVSQFLETRTADGKETASRSPVVTVIRAPAMRYTDNDRLAHYTGGAMLVRPGLSVRGRELRIWLADDKKKKPAEATGPEPPAASSIERLFADGEAQVVHTLPDRVRTGKADHAEYFADEDRLVLIGGDPVMNDSRRGVTRGRRLTLYARQDKLLVESSGSGPAVTRVLQK